MSNQKLWFGFLEADSKSSPVVRDLNIETGTDSIYLYNMKSGKISLYKTAIVESKLRELKPAEEKEFLAEMEAGYKNASKDFKFPSSATLYSSSGKVSAKKAKANKNEDEDLAGIDSDDINLDIDTELIDTDSEMTDDDDTEDDTEIVDDDN